MNALAPTAERLCVLALVLVACGDPPVAKWDKGLAATSALYPARRGLLPTRGIIHLHSVYSHDACDGMPVLDGVSNAPCAQHLRAALCQTHQDFAMLTDHDDRMASAAWDELFLEEPGDETVTVAGEHVGSRLMCPDGTQVLTMVGSENDLMPLGLTSEVAATVAEREAILNGDDAAAAMAMRAHGAIIGVAHGESHSLEQMRAVEADAVEVYNLHANLDPKIRTLMGLDPSLAITATGPFLNRNNTTLESDLVMLAFFEENTAELGKYETLLGEGRHVTGTLGTDAHENAVPLLLADDERGDSYRRMLRWFANYVLVSEVTPATIKDALVKGRAYGVFEVFGAPVGFDFFVEGAVPAEMGDLVQLADAPTLVLSAPAQKGVRARILRVDASGSAEVASSDGKVPLRYVPDAPGAYRAEIRVTPHHLVPYMGTQKSALLREYVWVYANPIYVR